MDRGNDWDVEVWESLYSKPKSSAGLSGLSTFYEHILWVSKTGAFKVGLLLGTKVHFRCTRTDKRKAGKTRLK